jgi:hypothetical protein
MSVDGSSKDRVLAVASNRQDRQTSQTKAAPQLRNLEMSLMPARLRDTRNMGNATIIGELCLAATVAGAPFRRRSPLAGFTSR